MTIIIFFLKKIEKRKNFRRLEDNGDGGVISSGPELSVELPI